jgi:ABC-2 type transport system permease protein
MPTMRADKIRIIFRREYLSRVRTKGFWIGTVILPVFLVAMMVVPSLVIAKTEAELRLALVDETGELGTRLAERLREKGGAGRQASNFELETLPAPAEPGGREALRRRLDERVLQEELDAWIWLPADVLERNRVEYHGESTSNFITQEVLEDRISDVLSAARLAAAGYDAARVGELTRSVELDTLRVTAEGGKAEAGLAGLAIAYFLFFLLYIMIAIYGAQVMNGVLEEKSSRVVEVVVSAVTPFELLLGKLLGIGGVALTQIAIWLATAAVITAPGVVAALAWLPPDVGMPSLGLATILHFFALFLLGFFMFAGFYAAIGAAFNDIREAQQAASSAMFLLVPPMLFFPVVMNDPDSTLAVVTSLIPFFTPLVMMLRIAIKTPPLWQLCAGYVLTGAFTVGMVWLAAKIYRVGILMYGKKPTLRELVRWVRYA